MSDRGSVGLKHKLFLFNSCDVRGLARWDPTHIRHDHWINAVSAAGLTDAKLEGRIVINFRRGSHRECTAFHKLGMKAKNWHESNGPADSIFQIMYPKICHFWYKGQLPIDYGSEHHAQFMYDNILECPLWTSAGTTDKPSRWFEWHRLVEPIMPWVGYLELILLELGLGQMWYRTVQESPLYQVMLGELAVDDVTEAYPITVWLNLYFL